MTDINYLVGLAMKAPGSFNLGTPDNTNCYDIGPANSGALQWTFDNTVNVSGRLSLRSQPPNSNYAEDITNIHKSHYFGALRLSCQWTAFTADALRYLTVYAYQFNHQFDASTSWAFTSMPLVTFKTTTAVLNHQVEFQCMLPIYFSGLSFEMATTGAARLAGSIHISHTGNRILYK